MDNLIEKFEKIKKSKDLDEINDFLIELGKNPQKENLSIIDYFIENYDPARFDQIKLNLIYNIGEIGLKQSIDTKYLDFLIEEYYSSDRWVRNEIINALNKLAHHMTLSEKIFDILKYAILDDYLPISVNAMKTILLYKSIPDEAFKKIFKLLDTTDLKLQEQISNVSQKFIQSENHLFELLNNSKNYRMLNKKAFRFLLLTFFNSALSLSNLDSFRKLLENSEWDLEYKEKFLNEIDIYQKLLLRSV